MRTINDKREIQRFYDEEASVYIASRYRDATCDGVIWRLRQELVLDLIGSGPATVLDIGSGPGVLSDAATGTAKATATATATATGDRFLVCADLSFNMVKEGRAANGGSGVGWVNADLSRLPVAPRSVDILVVVGVFCLVKEPEAALRELSSVLRPGGRLIIQVPSALNPTRVIERVGRHRRRYEQRIADSSIRPQPYRVAEFERMLRDVGLRPDQRRYYDFRVPWLSRLSTRLDTAAALALHRRLSGARRLGQVGEGAIIGAVAS